MPIRIPVKGVIVFRDKQQVRPPLGKPFEFTQQEIEDLERAAPGHVRKPIMEDDGSMVADKTPVKTKKAKIATEAPKPEGDL